MHTLIINGAECEPYLTSDHRTMVEYAPRVLFGIRVMMRSLGVTKCVVGIERNKPDAIEAMRAAVPADLAVEILPLTVKYPQGAEKMLIKAVTGVEVPSGKLPVTVGVVVQNVGSVAAIAEVFETGFRLTSVSSRSRGPACGGRRISSSRSATSCAISSRTVAALRSRTARRNHSADP